MTAVDELSAMEKMRLTADGPPVIEVAAEPKPYNGQPTFAYQPEDGSDPIVFPKSATLWQEVDGKKAIEFLWEVRKLNEAYQAFEFMDRAKVPNDIQRRVVRLPDDERRRFFAAWFKDLSEPPEAGLPPE